MNWGSKREVEEVEADQEVGAVTVHGGDGRLMICGDWTVLDGKVEQVRAKVRGLINLPIIAKNRPLLKPMTFHLPNHAFL